MKILFLDVDGVINTSKLIKEFGCDYIDDDLVKIINFIVQKTNCKIVLSSTWRIKEKDKKVVDSAFSKYGVKIYDCTPLIESSIEIIERKLEIKKWLENKKVEKFAIVDDWKDADIGHSFFLTSEKDGITYDLAQKIIYHLNSTN